MSFRVFVKNHLVLSIGFAAALLLFLGALSVVFTQGTFVDSSSGCGDWMPVENPETGDTFESVSDLEEFVEGREASLPNDLELEVMNGVVHQKLGCVNMVEGM